MEKYRAGNVHSSSPLTSIYIKILHNDVLSQLIMAFFSSLAGSVGVGFLWKLNLWLG